MRKICLFVLAVTAWVPVIAQKANSNNEWLAYIGTYSRGKSKGIYAYRFKPATGDAMDLGLAAETSNPSYLAIHPNQRFLYAVNENNAGEVSAFEIDHASGKLKFLNRVSAKGAAPCHLTLDKKGKWLIVANYTSGSTTVLPVHADGTLGDASGFVQHSGSVFLKERQGGPHAHYVTVSADNRFVLVSDLGLDQVLIFKLDSQKGTLTPNQPPYGKTPPGTGPRHGAFRPDRKFFYSFNEIKPGVTVFKWDGKKGSLDDIQTISSLPDGDATPNVSGAEAEVHPNGKFLYVSNRGHNSIAMFSIATDGKLTAGPRTPTQGRTPRSFGIDPTGRWLFAENQESDNIVLFKLDPDTGALTPAGKTLSVGVPVSIAFTPAK